MRLLSLIFISVSAVEDDEINDTKGKEMNECKKMLDAGEGSSRMTNEDRSEMETLCIGDGIENQCLEAKSNCNSPASSHGGIYSVCVI